MSAARFDLLSRYDQQKWMTWGGIWNRRMNKDMLIAIIFVLIEDEIVFDLNDYPM